MGAIHSTPDPEGLAIAREIREAAQTAEPDPKAVFLTEQIAISSNNHLTLLFGSRARGDYEENRSDVDILMVRANKPDYEERAKADKEASAKARAIYGREVSVQLVWITTKEFLRMRRSVNHIAARAAREGIEMPRNPENHSGNEYNEEEETDWRNDFHNEWNVTDQRIRRASSHLDDFRILNDNGGNDLGIGEHAHQSLEHALKAVISATGTRYDRNHLIGTLVNDANKADPDLNFTPGIDVRILNQYAGSEDYYPAGRKITEVEGYAHIIEEDIEFLCRRARLLQQNNHSDVEDRNANPPYSAAELPDTAAPDRQEQ